MRLDCKLVAIVLKDYRFLIERAAVCLLAKMEENGV